MPGIWDLLLDQCFIWAYRAKPHGFSRTRVFILLVDCLQSGVWVSYFFFFRGVGVLLLLWVSYSFCYSFLTPFYPPKSKPTCLLI